MFAAVSVPGLEGLVHQPQHRDWEERPVAGRRGPGGVPVRHVAAGGSDRRAQLLQERLQVGNWNCQALHEKLLGTCSLFLFSVLVKELLSNSSQPAAPTAEIFG